MALLDLDRPSAVDGRTGTPRAAWVSPALHIVVFVTLGFLARQETAPASTTVTEKRPLYPLVWLERAGVEHGGGRYANKSPTPAPRAQRPGQARLNVPAPAPRSTARKPRQETPPQEIDIPALPEVSGLREVPGTMSAVSVAITPGGGPDVSPGSGDGAGPGLDRGVGGNYGGGRRSGGSGVEPPQLIRQVRPNYTSSALQARVRGIVVMDAVVMPDGSVGDVKVVRSLDSTFGLDQEAIKAVKQWRFRAARRAGGDAIAMLVSVEMLFELR